MSDQNSKCKICGDRNVSILIPICPNCVLEFGHRQIFSQKLTSIINDLDKLYAHNPIKFKDNIKDVLENLRDHYSLLFPIKDLCNVFK